MWRWRVPTGLDLDAPPSRASIGNGQTVLAFDWRRTSMCKVWLTIFMLGGSCLLAGCAPATGQPNGDRAPRGLYVGGGGGYVTR